MACVIQWTGPTGPTTGQRDSAIEALKYPTKLLAKERTVALQSRGTSSLTQESAKAPEGGVAHFGYSSSFATC
jgi:hypothetical protein